jgi:lipoprotein-anchoring transpeptidase ErfK/SrfK
MSNNIICGNRRRNTRSNRALFVLLGVIVLSAASGLQAQAATLSSSDRPSATIYQCAQAGTACGKWIEVSLSKQRLTAYLGNRPVFSTLISSGVARHPTVTGVYHVYTKLRYDRMTGGVGREHYDLPRVPHVMYFFSGYAIHGAYWHRNFGRPMSHGCINTSLSAAAWLFNWTPHGTAVWVHY